MNIDLREEFDKILDGYGHYILLQRTSRKLRCRCFDELRREGDPKCRICVGKGWLSRIERHKVRHDSAFPPTARSSLTATTPVGHLWTDGKIMYFRHNVDLKVGDMVFEVGWDKTNPHKPTHLMHTYYITDVFEYRGENGRVEYRSCVSKTEASNNGIRNIVVRSLGPIKNYELVY